jgi:hypothetical protein
MSTPFHLVGHRARPSHRENRRVVRKPFRLYKKISKRRMRAICLERLHDNLAIACQLDGARRARVIYNRNTPNLCRVIRCNSDFHPRLDLTIAPHERDAIACE